MIPYIPMLIYKTAGYNVTTVSAPISSIGSTRQIHLCLGSLKMVPV